MLPSISIYDMGNCGFAALEKHSYLCFFKSFGEKISYFNNLFLIQNCVVIFRALGAYNSAFFECVSHIVRMRSDKKMKRINAVSNIAFVANGYSVNSNTFWNFTKVNFPTNAMRRLSGFSLPYFSISTTGFRAFPNPARFSFVYLSPKVFEFFGCKFDFFRVFGNTVIKRLVHIRIMGFLLVSRSATTGARCFILPSYTKFSI